MINFEIPKGFETPEPSFTGLFTLPMSMLPKAKFSHNQIRIIASNNINSGTSILGSVCDFTVRLWNMLYPGNKEFGLYFRDEAAAGVVPSSRRIGYDDSFQTERSPKIADVFVYFTRHLTEEQIQGFERLPGFTPDWKNPNLTHALKPEGGSLFQVYLNPDPSQMATKRMIVVTNAYSWELQYKILGVMTRLIADHSPNKLPTNQRDSIMEFFAHLVADNKQGLFNYLTDFRNNPLVLQLQETMFEQCFKHPINKLLEELKHKENSISQNIQDYLAYVHNYYKDLADVQLQIEALMNTPATEDKQKIKDYIEKSPFITNFYYDPVAPDERVHLLLEAPLAYWDEAVAKRLYTSWQTAPEKQHIMKAIFIDQTYKLWCTSHIILDINSGHVIPERDHIASASAIPHPHLDTYRCYGNNSNLIAQALKSGDYLVMFEQALAAHYGINLLDGAVFSSFVSNFTNEDGMMYDITCLEHRESKERITPRQFFEGGKTV